MNSTKKAKELCKEMYDYLLKHKIDCKKVFFRSESIVFFDALYIIPENDFLYKNKIYEFKYEIRKNNNTENFDFDMSFMPYSKNINYELIKSDGFVLFIN